MKKPSVAELAFLGWCTLATACGASDDGDPSLGAPRTYPVPGCERIDHRACDIREAPCQARLMQLAACLRGSDPIAVPPVTTMTETEFAAYLNASLSEDPPPDPNPYEIALASFGLVRPGALGQAAVVATDVEFIWGLYRREQKDVIIVDHGTPSDQPDPNSVLLHEFVHALQDVDVGLQRFYDEYATDYDSYLAAASIVEGEARMHQSRFYASLLGLDPAHLDWNEHFREVAEAAEESVIEADSPYVATYSMFQYEFGARYVNCAWLENGAEGVDRLFASPPTRTQAVMASVSKIVNADWPAPEFAPLEAPAPFEPWTRTTLGAWGSLLLLSLSEQPDVAHDLALEWRGDDFEVYVGGGTPTETVGVWRIEFSSESVAERARSLVQFAQSDVSRVGSRLIVVVSSGSSPLEWAHAP